MQFKEKFMSLTVGKGTRIMDIVRHVGTQASPICSGACRISLRRGHEFVATGCRQSHGDHETTARLGAGVRAVTW